MPEDTEQKELVSCEDCGKDFEPDDNEFGDVLCEDCREHYHLCAGCGKRVHEDDECFSEIDSESFCRSCYEERYTQCYQCSSEIYQDDVRSGSDGNDYCSDCWNDRFVECSECGETIRQDYAMYDEESGEYYCEDCYRERSPQNHIYEYHHFHGTNVFHALTSSDKYEEDNTLYLGVELETDAYEEKEDCAGELYDLSKEESIFHMETDGSLDNGIEIISEPCTLEYHRNKFVWDKITESVRSHGGKSNDTSTCGLHIHFNKGYWGTNQDINSLKLLYIFERFWSELVKFSRRNGEHWQHYAQRYYDDFVHCDDVPSKIRETRDKGRYFAVNLIPSETIEIRLFKGTLKVSTLIASIEMVDFLVNYIMNTNIVTVQSLQWQELVNEIDVNKYPELVSYLEARNLLHRQAVLFKEEIKCA
jgi:hypothetical protein